MHKPNSVVRTNQSTEMEWTRESQTNHVTFMFIYDTVMNLIILKKSF